VTRLQLDIEGAEPFHHLEGGVQRPLGVVLTHGGHAEDRHDGVSDELLDGSAPRIDGSGHGVEVRIEDRAQPFRVEPVRKGSGPDRVREQHGDELSLHEAPPILGATLSPGLMMFAM
jgi:hypothetical protein